MIKWHSQLIIFSLKIKNNLINHKEINHNHIFVLIKDKSLKLMIYLLINQISQYLWMITHQLKNNLFPYLSKYNYKEK